MFQMEYRAVFPEFISVNVRKGRNRVLVWFDYISNITIFQSNILHGGTDRGILVLSRKDSPRCAVSFR